MNIRFDKESIRVRLFPDDLNLLRIESNLSEHFMIGDQDFSLKIFLGETQAKSDIAFDKSCFLLQMPRQLVLAWINSHEVEFGFDHLNSKQKKILISVEKELKPMKVKN